MKLRDLPLHKKITLTNFMMIIIPVALVVVIMVGILIGILAGAGSSFTIAAVEKLSGTTTNYQLQLMMDSVSEDIVENSRAFEEGSALLEICGAVSYTHLMTRMTERIRPIKERTKPAVAMPLGFCFFALEARMRPTIPQIRPTHTNTNAKMTETIPSTSDTIASVLLLFSIMIPP